MPPERFRARRAVKGVRLEKPSSSGRRRSRSWRCHLVDVGVEGDIFRHGQIVIEAEALGHVADLLLEALRRP